MINLNAQIRKVVMEVSKLPKIMTALPMTQITQKHIIMKKQKTKCSLSQSTLGLTLRRAIHSPRCRGFQQTDSLSIQKRAWREYLL